MSERFRDSIEALEQDYEILRKRSRSEMSVEELNANIMLLMLRAEIIRLRLLDEIRRALWRIALAMRPRPLREWARGYRRYTRGRR